MDTSKMLRIEGLDAPKTFALFARSEDLLDAAKEFYSTLDMAYIQNQVMEIMNHYDLGEVQEVYEIFGGYVNRSFGAYTEKNGKRLEYFVRKYKKGVTEKEIMFEHSLINFSIDNGFNIAAKVIPAKDGKTFVKLVEGKPGAERDEYFAIYEYLPGEDKYSWIENEWNDEECASTAEVVAAFHSAARSFDPKDLERVEPKIMELLPMLPEIFDGYKANNLQNNKLQEFFEKNYDAILAEISRTVIPAEDLAKMPMNPIHCDLHPGNLKYSNNKAVGIFDFDWSKIDTRMFELGLGLVYCCSSWLDETDGVLYLDKSRIFLQAYQAKLKELNGLAPINETEKKYLLEMLSAGNLYLIYWCLRSYYSDLSLNVFEYLAYLKHQVRLMFWIREHAAEINEIAKSI